MTTILTLFLLAIATHEILAVDSVSATPVPETVSSTPVPETVSSTPIPETASVKNQTLVELANQADVAINKYNETLQMGSGQNVGNKTQEFCKDMEEIVHQMQETMGNDTSKMSASQQEIFNSILEKIGQLNQAIGRDLGSKIGDFTKGIEQEFRKAEKSIHDTFGRLAWNLNSFFTKKIVTVDEKPNTHDKNKHYD